MKEKLAIILLSVLIIIILVIIANYLNNKMDSVLARLERYYIKRRVNNIKYNNRRKTK